MKTQYSQTYLVSSTCLCTYSSSCQLLPNPLVTLSFKESKSQGYTETHLYTHITDQHYNTDWTVFFSFFLHKPGNEVQLHMLRCEGKGDWKAALQKYWDAVSWLLRPSCWCLPVPQHSALFKMTTMFLSVRATVYWRSGSMATLLIEAPTTLSSTGHSTIWNQWNDMTQLILAHCLSSARSLITHTHR